MPQGHIPNLKPHTLPQVHISRDHYTKTTESTALVSPNALLALRLVFDMTCHHAFCGGSVDKRPLYHLNFEL